MTNKKLTKKEREVLRIMQDPVLWVSKHISEPRWYQKLVLRHPHHRTVLRMGRRLGKCIAGTERILDPTTGQYITIQELYDTGVHQPHLYTLDGDEMISSNAFHIEDNGIKEVFKVKTIDGTTVRLTGNHPVLTKRGWIEVDNLISTDELALPSDLPYIGTRYVDSEEIEAWVEHTDQLPKDIYEWVDENLIEFLLTYIKRYGTLTKGEFDFDGLDDAIIAVENEQLARNLKHLFLRVGLTTRIKRSIHGAPEGFNSPWFLRVTGVKEDDYYFSPLELVVSDGEEQTYDVHVSETHNLVVEDMFVHNTWTMASHILWVAMTNWGGRLSDRQKGLDLLVVTPYDVQAKEIYETLLEMIDNNEALRNSLDYSKQGPPREIKLLNGNTIKLFTAGTSSSSNAASIRGQRADFHGNPIITTFIACFTSFSMVIYRNKNESPLIK